MSEHWYKEAVVYCLDVETFADSNGDGIGDIQGLIGRLDYLGTLAGLDELLAAVHARGMRLIMDLVVNHTSDEHPWFQSARSSPDSPYRDWFVWSAEEPPDRHQGMVFPGEQRETWSYDSTAELWYYHRFYDFQPDLNFANPAVREEIKKIMAFWIQLGVSGFRMDAVPFIIELTEPGKNPSPMDFEFLTDLRRHLQWRRGDAVLLAEANVEADKLVDYFADAGGSNNRLHMLFDFMLNGRLVLALARKDPEPILEAVRTTPSLPPGAQWATFLRNHDEIDLSRLTTEQREDVFAEFGPDPSMHLYDRGIRRRLAPMLGGDRARVELAYSLQFTLRGTPVLRYGEEIGMGEDLSLPERQAIRTPMQWSSAKHGGFTSADKPVRPVVSGGDFGYEKVNVTDQRHDPTSLLAWFERMIHTLRESPEVGAGACTPIDQKLPPGVFAHRADGPSGSMVFLHNLGETPCTVDLSYLEAEADYPNQVFGDQPDEPVDGLSALGLGRYGYRWIRLNRNPAG